MVTLGTDTNTQLIQLARKAGMEQQLTDLIMASEHTRVAILVMTEGKAVVDELNSTRSPKQEPFSFEALVPATQDSVNENVVWLRNLQRLFMALPSQDQLAATLSLAATQT